MLRHEGKRNVLDILIVDDDPETRRVLREILEPLEHSVVEAGNGREALPLVERHQPDLMIVDILMPEMDGLETIRFLRRKGYRMPIIAMPAGKYLTEQRYSEFARSFGADDILLKPFGQADVLKVLRRTLGRGGLLGDSNSSATG
jgi:CheY-like chemotaxis protein